MAKDDECLSAIVAASEGRLDHGDAEEILYATKRARDLNVSKGLSQAEALNKAASDIVERQQILTEQARTVQFLNLQKRVGRRNDILTKAEELRADQPTDKAMGEALGNLLTPTHKDITGAYDTLEGRMRAMTQQFVLATQEQLDRAGLTHYAYDRTNTLAIAKELDALSREDGKPGLTKDKYAQQVAQILHAPQTAVLHALRNEGVYINNLEGYIAQQSRDWQKVAKTPFDEYRSVMLERLDHEKTFAGRELDDVTPFLRNTYDNEASGLHLKAGNEEGLSAPAYSGPGNIAKKLTQARTFHFKDPESWVGDMQQFGKYETVTENIMASLQRSARNIALINRFGTNPAAEFAADINYTLEHYQPIDPNAVGKFRDGRYTKDLQNIFKMLDGTGDRPSHTIWANLFRGLQSEQMLEVGGSIPFAHFSVPVTQASAMKFHGGSYFEGYSNFAKGMLDALSPSARKDLAELASAQADGMNSHLFSSYSFTGAGMRGGTFLQQLGRNFRDHEIAGTLSTLSAAMLKSIGVNFFIDGGRRSFERWEAASLAKQQLTPFNELDALHQSTLKSFKIGPDEWGLIQGIKDLHEDRNGVPHLTPDLVHTIDDAKVETMLRGRGDIRDKASAAEAARQVSRFKDELTLRMATYFSEGARMATNVPSIKTKALLHGQNGNILRATATQFKQWPV